MKSLMTASQEQNESDEDGQKAPDPHPFRRVSGADEFMHELLKPGHLALLEWDSVIGIFDDADCDDAWSFSLESFERLKDNELDARVLSRETLGLVGRLRERVVAVSRLLLPDAVDHPELVDRFLSVFRLFDAYEVGKAAFQRTTQSPNSVEAGGPGFADKDVSDQGPVCADFLSDRGRVLAGRLKAVSDALNKGAHACTSISNQSETVTCPSVASWILRIMSRDGNRFPFTYLLMVTWVAPTSLPKAS
ncbi:hypothetical protein [Ensifer sp. PDNC004]|uniref:hypothetical protein n=1 Tax=Ensifer sp. PDNC004 TaxID=2811423 RepID=UPI001FEE528F|nr:hypothetical protein [Ensifer sp. PDNC004]